MSICQNAKQKTADSDTWKRNVTIKGVLVIRQTTLRGFNIIVENILPSVTESHAEDTVT